MLAVLFHHNPVNHLARVEIIPIVNFFACNAAQCRNVWPNHYGDSLVYTLSAILEGIITRKTLAHDERALQEGEATHSRV
jgi:hypothetical protein